MDGSKEKTSGRSRSGGRKLAIRSRFLRISRSARSVFMGAVVHGIWALHCTHLAFIGWISSGTALTIVVYWFATIKLVREAFVIVRKQETEHRAQTNGNDAAAQPLSFDR